MTESQSPANISPSGEATKATVAKFLMAAVGFAGNIYFARILGPERIGGFYLLVAISLFLGRPMAGMSDAVRKRASEVGTSTGELITILGLFGGGWFVIVSIGTLLLSNFLISYTGVQLAPLLLIMYFGSELVYGTFVPILQAQGKVGLAFSMDALRSYVEIPIQLALITLGYGVPGLITGLVVANAVVIPIASVRVNTWPTRPSANLISRVTTYAKLSVPNAIIGTAYGRLDTFLLGALLSQAVVGDYGVAVRLTMPAMYVASSISSTAFVRVSYSESRDEGIKKDATNAIAFSTILAVPIFFGGAVVADSLINIVYGTAYTSAATFIIVLGIQRIFESQTKVILDIINGLNRPDITLRLSIISLVVNIPLGILLVYKIGAIGVVIATIVAEIIRYVGASLFIHRIAPEISIFTLTLMKQLLAGTVMAVFVTNMKPMISINSLFGLSITLVIGAGVYGATLLLTSSRVRDTASGIFSMAVNRFNWV